MRILVTGGCGYIGSHVVRHLLSAELDVVVLDNLTTGALSALAPEAEFIQGDIRDTKAVMAATCGTDAVMHLAGVRFAGLGQEFNALTHAVNVGGTRVLLHAMERNEVPRFVFASSSAVYGDTGGRAADEAFRTLPVSPYGRSKLAAERTIAAWADRPPGSVRRSAVILRFFNVMGVSTGVADRFLDSLLPALFACSRQGSTFSIHGLEHDTPDGSPLRDFVHVDDIARGHVQALRLLDDTVRLATYNLGCGSPISVLDIVSEFARWNVSPLAIRDGGHRRGDPSCVWSSSVRAQDQLDWQPLLTMSEMVESSLARWSAEQTAFAYASDVLLRDQEPCSQGVPMESGGSGHARG